MSEVEKAQAIKKAVSDLEHVYAFKKVGANLWRGEHYWATVKGDGRIRFSVAEPEVR